MNKYSTRKMDFHLNVLKFHGNFITRILKFYENAIQKYNTCFYKNSTKTDTFLFTRNV